MAKAGLRSIGALFGSRLVAVGSPCTYNLGVNVITIVYYRTSVTDEKSLGGGPRRSWVRGPTRFIARNGYVWKPLTWPHQDSGSWLKECARKGGKSCATLYSTYAGKGWKISKGRQNVKWAPSFNNYGLGYQVKKKAAKGLGNKTSWTNSVYRSTLSNEKGGERARHEGGVAKN